MHRGRNDAGRARPPGRGPSHGRGSGQGGGRDHGQGPAHGRSGPAGGRGPGRAVNGGWSRDAGRGAPRWADDDAPKRVVSVPVGSPPAGHTGPLSWVRLRAGAAGWQAFGRMIASASPDARPGDVVAVYDHSGAPCGVAFYNPASVIALRWLSRTAQDFDLSTFLSTRLARAVELRQTILGLERTTDAYRLVHDMGDDLPGLVVDRYGSFVVLELYALGMFRLTDTLEKLLSALLPGARFFRRASRFTQEAEGFTIAQGPPAHTRIRENGVVFEVDVAGGFKTGFFCDQRENRRLVAQLAGGRRVLDVCSYTGGFGVSAMAVGGAREAVCVELDAAASAKVRRNAHLNDVSVETVCVDAFPYLRQMGTNRERYGLVVLDPHKLIASKETFIEGRNKYQDLNSLAMRVVDDGGLLVTCSCSGMLSWDAFDQVVRTAASMAGRRVQILRRSGAGPDHPVAAHHPESEYLKVLFCRLF